MGLCRGGSVYSNTDLEHFLGEGGGRDGGGVTAAEVVPLGQCLLTSSECTRVICSACEEMQISGPPAPEILILSIEEGLRLFCCREPRIRNTWKGNRLTAKGEGSRRKKKSRT